MRRSSIFISLLLLATTLWADTVPLKTLLQKAKKGDATAQYDLALEYMFGKQFTKSGIEHTPRYHEAAKWLNKAAKAGHAESQYMLGTLYERGRGVKHDNKQAIHWYKQALDNQFKEAACPLARLYEKSDIHPKDPDITLPCYMK